VENEIVEDEVIDRIVDFCEESFNLLASHVEILMHHLLEVGSLLEVGVDVLSDDVAHLFDCHHIVCSLVFLMEANTTFGFANGSFVTAGEAGTQLDSFGLVDIAEDCAVGGVAQHHGL
jgi:hypothetical protein